jgi:RecA-family ATPase
LARHLAVAVARGETFLGRSSERGTVLYFALEEKRVEVKNHLVQLGAKQGDPIRILCGAVAKEDSITQLRAALKAESNVKLVIIDPIFRFLKVRDCNDYQQVNDQMERLMELVRDSDTHIMAVHHEKKRQSEDPMDGTLGSTAINGGVDTCITLKVTGTARNLYSRQRYGTELPETQLVWDAESRKVGLGQTTEGAELEAAQRTRKRIDSAILDFVEQNPSSTQAEVFNAVSGNVQLKKEAFRELVAKGLLVERGEGVKGKPFTYVVVTQHEAQNRVSGAIVSA